jgi:Ca-activated chloride channel homolog
MKAIRRMSALITIMVLVLIPCWAASAEFSAEIAVTGQGVDAIYQLHVKTPFYRIQKITGPITVPPFPSIVNQETGITWGLNPQQKQYVEIADIEKTAMMNPLVGWTLTRKGMTGTPGPTETINGYACETTLYTTTGQSTPAAKVWIAKVLDHIVREERFGLNANPVLELRNIQEGPVDPALFQIPEGYQPAAGPNGSTAAADKPAAVTAVGATQATPHPAGADDSANAGATQNIVFILDASGSMWGQVEGQAKIAIAKEVLANLVRELPDDAVVGLVAYGHRRKGDCDDVEELVSLGPLDKEKMVAQIQALSPKGKTPISRSVRLTAERIKHLEDETTIILVSDGKETCDPDPCGLVKDLKASGIKFVMHVIGFDVTEAERQELECMAREGGGQYYTASNAGEFLAAAQEVVQKSTPPYGILKVTATKNGKPFPTFVTLTHQESGKHWTPASTSGESGTVEIRLDPGTYQAELKDSGITGGQTPTVHLKDIVIAAGETVERAADFSDGTLVITTLLNGQPFRGNVFFYRQGEEKHFHNEMTSPSAGQSKRQLMPGRYRVDVWGSEIAGPPVVALEDLVIPPGGTVAKTVEFFAGELTITVTHEGEPFATPIEINNAAGKQVFKNWSNWPKTGTRVLTLPEGDFTVRVTNIRDQKHVATFDHVHIAAGTSETITVAFPLTE